MADLLDELTAQDLTVNTATSVVDEEYEDFDKDEPYYVFFLENADGEYDGFREDVSYVLETTRMVKAFGFECRETRKTDDEVSKVFIVNVRLDFSDFLSLCRFWCALMRELFQYTNEESGLKVMKIEDCTVKRTIDYIDEKVVEDYQDMMNIVSNVQLIENIWGFFEHDVPFSYKSVAAAKHRIRNEAAFRRVKQRDGSLQYTYFIDVIYKKITEPEEWAVCVSGRSWQEMYIKTHFLNGCLKASVVPETREHGMKSKFETGGIFNAHYVWNPDAPFDVGGPEHFFKQCMQCMDKEQYDFDALDMAVDEIVHREYKYMIEDQKYDAQMAADLMQRIVDEFPMSEVLNNAREISDVLHASFDGIHEVKFIKK